MKEILKNIRRTPNQTLASVIVLTLSSLTIATLIFTSLFFTALLKKVEITPQIIIYFRPNTPTETITKLKDELGKNFKIKSIKFVSQEEALKIYKSLYKDEPLLTEMVTADMLPPSLEIKVKKPEELYKIAEFSKKQPGVDEVDFQKEVVDKLLSITKTLKKTTLAIGISVFVFTLIILISIISFKVSLKKEEIEILKLLGASNWFVFKPFIFENIFLATVSSIISLTAFYAVIFYFSPFINSFFWQGEDLLIHIYSFSLKIWPLDIKIILTIIFSTLLFSIISASLATILSAKKYVK